MLPSLWTHLAQPSCCFWKPLWKSFSVSAPQWTLPGFTSWRRTRWRKPSSVSPLISLTRPGTSLKSGCHERSMFAISWGQWDSQDSALKSTHEKGLPEPSPKVTGTMGDCSEQGQYSDGVNGDVPFTDNFQILGTDCILQSHHIHTHTLVWGHNKWHSLSGVRNCWLSTSMAAEVARPPGGKSVPSQGLLQRFLRVGQFWGRKSDLCGSEIAFSEPSDSHRYKVSKPSSSSEPREGWNAGSLCTNPRFLAREITKSDSDLGLTFCILQFT